MKSSVRARLHETACKQCIFATWDGKTQVGCMADRLKYFDLTEAYDYEKEFFVVNGACTYHRPSFWNQGDPSVQIAEIENMPGVCIIYDIGKNEKLIPFIESNLDAIDYPINKVSFVFGHSLNSHVPLIELHKKVRAKGYLATIVQVLAEEPWLRYNEFKRNDRDQTYTYFANPEKFEFCMRTINQIVNIDGDKLVCAESLDGNAVYIMSKMMNIWGGGTFEEFSNQVKQDCLEQGYYKTV